MEACDAAFSYGPNQVLTNCSLCVHPGELVSVVGQNGAGKSTLLKLLVGEIVPESGCVHLFNSPPDKFKEWKRVGYVPQEDASKLKGFPISVYEMVKTGLYASRGLFRLFNDVDAHAIEEALDKTQVKDLSHRMIGELSGGQRRRVLLARALVGHPELLILDEPTAGVDEQNARTFFGLLRRLVDTEGIGVCMVTHDVDLAREFSHRILLVSGGCVGAFAPDDECSEVVRA